MGSLSKDSGLNLRKQLKKLLMRRAEEGCNRDSMEEISVLWEELRSHLCIHIEIVTLSIFLEY